MAIFSFTESSSRQLELHTQYRQRLVDAFSSVRGSDTGSPDDGPSLIVLILDPHTIRMVSQLFRMTELREFGVVLVQLLSQLRKPQPDLSCIYMVEPSLENIQAILDDWNGVHLLEATEDAPEDAVPKPLRMYKAAHLLLTNIPTGDILGILRERVPQTPLGFRSVRALREVRSVLTDYLVVLPQAFTIDIPSSFSGLYEPRSLTTTSQLCSTIADRLACFLLAQELWPVFRYGPIGSLGTAKTQVAHRVCQETQTLLREYSTRNPAYRQRAMTSADGSLRPQATVIVVDRSFDFTALLVHDLHYGSTLYDMLPIVANSLPAEAAKKARSLAQVPSYRKLLNLALNRSKQASWHDTGTGKDHESRETSGGARGQHMEDTGTSSAQGMTSMARQVVPGLLAGSIHIKLDGGKPFDHVLSTGDVLWMNMFPHHFPAVLSLARNLMSMLDRQYPHAARLQHMPGGGAQALAGAGERGEGVHFTELRRGMSELRDYREVQILTSRHIQLADLAYNRINVRKVIPLSKIESGLAAEGLPKKFAQVQRSLNECQATEDEDRARLAMLYQLCIKAKLDMQTQKLTAQVREPFVTILRMFSRLLQQAAPVATLGLERPPKALARSTATKAQIKEVFGRRNRLRLSQTTHTESGGTVKKHNPCYLPEAFYLLQEVLDPPGTWKQQGSSAAATDPSYFPARFPVAGEALQTERSGQEAALQGLMVRRVRTLPAEPPLDQQVVFKPPEAPPALGSRNTNPPIILFILGGMTLGEARAAWKLSRIYGREVYVGSTHLLTPKEFLNDLSRF